MRRLETLATFEGRCGLHLFLRLKTFVQTSKDILWVNQLVMWPVVCNIRNRNSSNHPKTVLYNNVGLICTCFSLGSVKRCKSLYLIKDLFFYQQSILAIVMGIFRLNAHFFCFKFLNFVLHLYFKPLLLFQFKNNLPFGQWTGICFSYETCLK
jgi:hypothetical protein